MPKRVDHEARRSEIAEALMRLASKGGLEAVSLRDVAAEAGVSMGAVQHYFRSKDDMLAHAMEHVNSRAEQRIKAQFDVAVTIPRPREVLRVLMIEMLALSEESRTEFLTAVSFFVRALGSPRLAELYRQSWPQLEDWVAAELRRAQDEGELPADRDPKREAELLVVVPDGLSFGLLLGHRTPAEAVAAVDHYLDRLFS
ncbi:TetR/AcrR family transcriptional regulator [Saccharopolyspora dendranthemae]|uniref:TetR family transcriptional regulator n=1 Tax=Saccharopolyspora dendranthemae TaxID=1181886 RepID=A0A561U656_9PSEU|nr:TetR family transcriptional regulator C-terminal domain-containing protein [Saccharopolyspora dendranthemae]TWF94844.1 TetR family transcriptional regulator [Saccharopolyspora dendranthemae]